MKGTVLPHEHRIWMTIYLNIYSSPSSDIVGGNVPIYYCSDWQSLSNTLKKISKCHIKSTITSYHHKRTFSNYECKVTQTSLTCKGVARVERGNPGPETERIVVENGVIFESSIFSNKFSKK